MFQGTCVSPVHVLSQETPKISEINIWSIRWTTRSPKQDFLKVWLESDYRFLRSYRLTKCDDRRRWIVIPNALCVDSAYCRRHKNQRSSKIFLNSKIWGSDHLILNVLRQWQTMTNGKVSLNKSLLYNKRQTHITMYKMYVHLTTFIVNIYIYTFMVYINIIMKGLKLWVFATTEDSTELQTWKLQNTGY